MLESEPLPGGEPFVSIATRHTRERALSALRVGFINRPNLEFFKRPGSEKDIFSRANDAGIT